MSGLLAYASDKMRVAAGTPRRVYAMLAGNSLIWQLLSDAADNVLVSAALTAVPIAVSELEVIGFVLRWLLYIYLIYRLLSRLLPSDEPAARVVHRREFKLLVVALSVVMAILIGDLLVTEWGASVLEIPTFVVDYIMLAIMSYTVVSTIIIGAYVYIQWFRYASPRDRVTFIQQIAPGRWLDSAREEELTYQTHGGWVTWVSTSLMIVLSGLLVTFACLLLGFVGGAASAMFPVSEVIIITGFSASALAERQSGSLSHQLRNISHRTVSPEKRFYASVRFAFSNIKGIGVVSVTTIGFVLTIVLVAVSTFALFVLGFLLLAGVLGTVFRGGIPTFPGSFGWWTLIGGLLCSAIPGAYALWFWVRETYRLPHYLKYWARSHSEDIEIGTPKDLPELVTRPPGYLLLIIPPIFLSEVFLRAKEGTGLPELWAPLFSLAWPLVLASVLWAVWWTLRSAPQHPRTDRHALSAAISVQTVGFSWWLTDRWWTISIPVITVILTGYYISDVTFYFEKWTNIKEGILSIGGAGASVVGIVGILLIAVDSGSRTGWTLFGSGVVVLAFIIFGLTVQRAADV